MKNITTTPNFPSYLEDSSKDCGRLKLVGFGFIQLLLNLSVKIFLRPRKGPVKDLDIDEVKKVYDREAATYDAKHHLTTHGMDTTWRRSAGWSVVNIGRNNGGLVSVLDLCTGTGLTIKEMSTLFSLWGIKGSIVGFDYNAKMLDIARSRNRGYDGTSIRYARGDAMSLVKNEQPSSSELEQFLPNSFDAVTQVFGIGGIDNPSLVFRGVLQVLKPGGQYLMTDMHQPITKLPGEWSFMLKWFNFPMLEAVTYKNTTLPLVLNRLWGWRDTTRDFYLLPLVSHEDKNGNKWGFKVINFEVESQRWWFGLPIMPVGKIIVEKVKLQ